VNFIEF